jgi:ABC-2 type transport system ATP-binding protein
VEQLADTVLLIVNGKLAASGGFRAIRAALNQRPYHVRVICDAPRKLAAAIVELDSVDAVHVDPDGAVVVLVATCSIYRSSSRLASAVDQFAESSRR